MTFYIDKKWAMKHYANFRWLWLILGVLLIALSLIFITHITFLVISIGIIFITISILKFDLGSYGNLTFYGKGFMLGKKETYGDSIFSKSNTYYYDIIKINNISVSQKFIILEGIFKKSKSFGKPTYFEDKLYKQGNQTNIVKIPRIYEKENDLLAELNKISNN